MRQLRVDLGERSYTIVVGANLLQRVGEWLEGMELADRVIIITHPHLKDLYGEAVASGLREYGRRTDFVLVPEGEEAKSLEQAAGLYDELLDRKIDRHTALLALGGGVLGDLVGFVAATVLRGVPYIQVPTTLLAQVDSAVGGKTAVNHPLGKNLIGVFYQPILVVADLATLTTLPPEEYLAGLAEVIKYGVIADHEFFAFLEEREGPVRSMDPEALEHVVLTSCALKAKVVEQDEREAGLRAILNFGHTIAHAVEAVDAYRTVKHGFAVAMGMACAARLSEAMGKCSAAEATRVVGCLETYGLPTRLPPMDPEALWEVMTRDKKVRGDRVRLVLMEAVGRVGIYDDVPREAVIDALAASQAA
ncbi:MAG: 3-dehydroquinate synthase [bacterium]|nr:3-dehydroquinate synthase [bacterium]